MTVSMQNAQFLETFRLQKVEREEILVFGEISETLFCYQLLERCVPVCV